MAGQDKKVTVADEEASALTYKRLHGEFGTHVEPLDESTDAGSPSAPSRTTSFPPDHRPEVLPDEREEEPHDVPVVTDYVHLGKGRTISDTKRVAFATPSTVVNPPRALAKGALAKLPEDVRILEQWKGHDSLVQSCALALVHSWRQFGYLPWLALALKRYPRHLIMSIIGYYSLRLNTKWWNDSVHKFLRYAASPEPTLIRANEESYDRNKQYMLAMHPHGMLACGWWSLLSRYEVDDEEGSTFSRFCGLLDNVDAYLCFAPCVQYMPLHGEIYQSKGTDASASTLRKILQVKKKSVAVAPGGFSEAVYTSYRPDQEVAFILGRYGFIKMAIESKVDVIPVYTFGINGMYSTMDTGRHQRAVLSQKYSVPFMMYWGKAGTSVPYNEDTVTVTFDPFPTSKYTLDQVKEAHRDYCIYLKKCFDEYKFVTESTKNSELVFAGRDHLPARL